MFFKKSLLFSICIIFVSSVVCGAIPASERAALIALYNSTNGDDWTDNSGWKDGDLDPEDGFSLPGTEGTWYGVTLSGDSVVNVALRINNLSGIIPPELGNLSNLSNLDFRYNQLNGGIPAELGNLSSLGQLLLNNNQLSGEIPSELGNLSNLRILYLFANPLSGSIPPELGNLDRLESLMLNNNQLSGPIPPELGTLSKLQLMRLEDNQLSGPIPSELGNLSNLDGLFLYYNQLSGPIPAELGNLSNLQYLYLQGNQLSGPIPPELGNLADLENLILSSNQLSGSIPPELTNLTSLTNLDIGYNALYTDNPDLVTFLNGKDPDWAATQTIAPTEVAAAIVAPGTITLSWTPIQYTGDTGGYRVYYAITPGGPYTFYAQIADKTANGMSVTGLYGGNVYFVIRTWTDPHWIQQNTLTSDLSEEVPSLTPPDHYLISGTISVGGVAMANVFLYTDGEVSGVYATDASGRYQVVVPRLWSGTVSPELDGFDFSPPQMSYTSLLSNQYNQDYFATSSVPGTITVVAPNGCEEWDTGSLRSVTWNGDGIVGNVKVEYSTDDAATWTEIAASTPNDGLLEWTVPDTPSTQCRVRVTDLSNPAVSDGCDGCFSITTSSGAMFVNDGEWTTAVQGVEGWYVGDFTGDGLEDLMNVTLLHQKVFQSDGTQFVKLGSWINASTGLYGWFPGDFNGDGRTDLLRYRDVNRAQVFLSTGSAFVKDFVWIEASPGTEGYTVGDFNGDGYDDMLTVDVFHRNKVFLSTGEAFAAPVKWFTGNSGEDGWYAGDFNGDGKTDLARVNLLLGTQVLLSTGAAFEKNGVWTQALPPSNGWFVADYNGDGKDDLMRCLEDLSGAEVFLSTGGGFAYDGCWCDVALLGADWRCGKFSADGRADLLRYDVSSVSSEVFVSTAAAGVPASVAAARRGGRKAGDLNHGIELRRPQLTAAQETELLAPWLRKIAAEEEGNYFSRIKKAVEKKLGRKVRDTVIHRMLFRHIKPKQVEGIR